MARLQSTLSCVIAIVGFSVVATKAPAQDATTDDALEKYVESLDIVDAKEKSGILEEATSIINIRQQFILGALMEPCFDELDQHCANEPDVEHALRCLKARRADVSDTCEDALQVEFGGPPLTEEIELKGISLPAGSVFYYRDKTSRDLDSVIYAVIPIGTTVRANGLVLGPGRIDFSEFGLRSGGLAYPQVFEGMKIEKNIFFDQYNNSLRTVFLAEDSPVKNLLLRGGTDVQFYKSGNLMKGQLAETQTIGDFAIPAHHIIVFNDDGTIQRVTDEYYEPWDGFR